MPTETLIVIGFIIGAFVTLAAAIAYAERVAGGRFPK